MPPHICAISLPGYPSQVVVRWLSDQGFCLSAGSACHRGQASHVYAAMGLSKPVRDGMLRVSFGPEKHPGGGGPAGPGPGHGHPSAAAFTGR